MRNARTILMVLIITSVAMLGGCSTKGTVKQDQMTENRVITDIIVADNVIEIRANGPFSYSIYKPGDPYRITLDIPDVGTGKFKERIVPKAAGITEIIPSQIESPKKVSRLEIILQNPSDVDPQYQNGVLALKVRETPGQVPDDSGTGAAAAEAPLAKSVSEEKVGVQEVKEDDPVAADTATAAKKGEQENTPIAAETPAVRKEGAASLSKATEIEDLRLESAGGVVKLIIKGDGAMVPTVFTLKNRIVIDVPEVSLRAKVPSTLFAPVKGLRAGKHKDKTRLVIDLREMRGFDVSSDRDSIVVAIQNGEAYATPARGEEAREQRIETQRPVTAAKQEAPLQKTMKAESAEKKEPPAVTASVASNGGDSADMRELETITAGKYSGKKISLDFQDADIVPIFRLLSDISGYNIVVNPEVKGKLTMKLINVPWDQCLDLILKTFSLGQSVEGNIIRIAPLSVFAKESDERSKAREAEVKAEAMETRIYPVSYADVAVVEKSIKDSKALSPRGSVSVDKRTSAMVVKDVPSVFLQIESMLVTLDKPIPQVLIEARIVEVNTTNSFDLGIQWGVKVNATNTLSSLGGFPTLGTGAFTGNNFMVDFPTGKVAAGTGSGFTFGLLNPSKTLGLDLQLSALEQVGNTKIISTPRLVTQDNEKATIMQGTSEPYPQLTPEGTVTTAFKDVVLYAEVVPHITPSGSVSMSVLVRKEDILNTVTISGSQVPRTSKIEGNMKVLVQDGETLVIGGVYKKIETNSTNGTPGLTSIPVLGQLFKSKSNLETVSELMMFITPRIIEKR